MGDKNSFFDFRVTPKTVAKIIGYLVVGAFLAGVAFVGVRAQFFSSVNPQPVARPPAQDVTQLELRINQDFVSKERHKADIGHVAETMGRIETGMKETLSRMEVQQTTAYGNIQKAQTVIKDNLDSLEERIEEIEDTR